MDSAKLKATQHIHIAIALIALKRKPPGQSLASYLLDLKARFPLPKHELRQSRLPDEDDPWRKRVLALEEENEALKLRAQRQELEVQALKAAPFEVVNTDQEPSQPPKKKKKVAQLASKTVPERPDLRALVKDIHAGPRLPALKDTLDVLSSFRTIWLSETRRLESEMGNETILIPNVKRALVALGKLLSAVLVRDASVVVASSRVNAVSCLCNLLLALLNSTLPQAERHVILPHVQGDLMLCIVRPIIRGFRALSVHELTSTIEGSRKTSHVDVRPDLLSILRRLIECLRALKARTRDLREFMVFEAAKEIEALWSCENGIRPLPMDGERTREQRIEKLARKDSLWYHCSIIHAALDQFPPSQAGESVLSSEAVRVLAGLVRHFECEVPVDEVAKGMVLGIVEKAWLSGLHESTAEEDLTLR